MNPTQVQIFGCPDNFKPAHCIKIEYWKAEIFDTLHACLFLHKPLNLQPNKNNSRAMVTATIEIEAHGPDTSSKTNSDKPVQTSLGSLILCKIKYYILLLLLWDEFHIIIIQWVSQTQVLRHIKFVPTGLGHSSMYVLHCITESSKLWFIFVLYCKPWPDNMLW